MFPNSDIPSHKPSLVSFLPSNTHTRSQSNLCSGPSYRQRFSKKTQAHRLRAVASCHGHEMYPPRCSVISEKYDRSTSPVTSLSRVICSRKDFFFCDTTATSTSAVLLAAELVQTLAWILHLHSRATSPQFPDSDSDSQLRLVHVFFTCLVKLSHLSSVT